MPLRELTEQALVLELSPVGALVNDHGDILYIHGHTGMYLQPAAGEPSTNILKMAREGLRVELGVALHEAAATSSTVRRPRLRVRTNGDFTSVDLTVRPVKGGPDDRAVLPGPPGADAPRRPGGGAVGSRRDAA